MASSAAGIPAIVREIGHKSMSIHVYSHPRAGIAAQLSWGVWKGSTNVRSKPQVTFSRDASLKDWEDALDVAYKLIAAARRQLELLDTADE